MKKIITTALLAATILTSPAFAAEDKVVATYKGGEVKESQVMQQSKPALDMYPTYKDKPFSELDASIQEALVRGFIIGKLIEQEAVNLKIESTKEFQDKLANAKNQLLAKEIMDLRLKSVLNDAMIDAEYKKLADSSKGKEEVKVAHILLDTEEKATSVKAKLNKGGKFNALAKEFSKDDGSKAIGGELGYVTKGQLVPEFEQKAFSMKANEVSDPVKTQFGWHIIKVLSKRPVQVPTKEEARQGLISKLNAEIIEKYVGELTTKADVKLNLPKAVEPVKEVKGIEVNDTKTSEAK